MAKYRKSTLAGIVNGVLIGLAFLTLGGLGYFCFDLIKNEPKRKIAQTKQDLRVIQGELKDYSFDGRRNRCFGDYPSSLRELFGYTPEDAWGNEFNYKKENGKFFAGIDNEKIIYTEAHYELSSSGPDGIPQTTDDIQAWHIPGHEWSSIEKLERKYQEEIKEARKSPFQKALESAKGSSKAIFERAVENVLERKMLEYPNH